MFRIPEVLQPFMLGRTFLPFVKRKDKTGKYVDCAPVAPQAAAAAAADGLAAEAQDSTA